VSAQGFFEALRRGEDPFDRAIAHDDLVYVEDPKWPGSSTYRGRDAVRACWAAYLEVLGRDIVVAVDEVKEVGDQVVAVVRVSGVSTETQIPFEHKWGYVCRTTDGRLSYLQAYFDPAEALVAASAS
jgi:ketosteroid isomerase-like protein